MLVPLLALAMMQNPISNQRECAHIVAADMEATRRKSPAVYQTVKDHTFVWSQSSQACVMVIQYWVQKKGKPKQVQILAADAITMQPMEGYDDIFLIPASNTQQVMDAVSFLVKKYSR